MYYVNKNVKDLYRVKYHDERGKVLRLDMNENPQGLPQDFVEEVKKKITPEFLATYPEKDRLLSEIARHNNIKEENITITCGSDEAMRLIFQCFGEEGKSVVTVTPTFEMYDVYCKMFGMNHVMTEYEDDFSMPVEKVLNSIDETTGIVVMLNPNSPIGTAFNEQEIERIIEKAAAMNAIIVVDEAYHYFYKKTFMSYINQYDNLIVLRTFSKLFSIAGLRIGYAAGNPLLIEYMEKAESTFNVNNVAILFAEELLKRPDIISAVQDSEAEGHQWLKEQLEAKGYQTFSQYGCYLLFRPKKDSGFIVEELKKDNIWIRDYKRGIINGWLRVSTGALSCMQLFWEKFSRIDR